MCGICGFVRSDYGETPDRAVIDRMVEALYHRGPDETAVIVEPGLAFGHTRLKVIDLKTGSQPIYNEFDEICVIFNGEIYNYHDLRADLETKGHTFRTRSDTEVLVHLWEEKGERMTGDLVGMFAFAIWDKRDRTLFIARDRAGQKPLYYMELPGGLAFASEIKALKHNPRFNDDKDYGALSLYLALLYIPAPWTIYRCIRKLPPAHQLLWRDGETTIEQYWRPSVVPDPHLDLPVWEEEFWRLFKDAVRMQMVADVPLGAFLSGGVDSSLVVAVMSEISSAPVKTFSMGFGDEINELPYARSVADRFGTEHHELNIDTDQAELIRQVTTMYGEPYADTSNVPSYILSKYIRQHVTVALNGDAGDELFGGYALTRAYARAMHYRRLGDVAAGLLKTAGRLGGKFGLSAGTAIDSILWSRELGQSLAAQPSPYLELVFRQFFGVRERADLLRPELDDPDADTEFRARNHVNGSLDPIPEALRFDYLEYLPGDLNVKMDIASMSVALEVRSPYMDHRLTEHAFRLPGGHKVDLKDTKKILRRMAGRYLPDDITARPKQGFGVPINAWLQDPQVKQDAFDMLGRSSDLPFRPEKLTYYIEGYYGGQDWHAYKVWQLLCYYYWNCEAEALS